MILKIIKFLFFKEKEIAPGVFWLGGTVYENRNKPTGEPPLKWKVSGTPDELAHKTPETGSDVL